MPKTLIAIILVAVLVAIFIFSFLLNKKTPKPEGCEDLSEDCSGCHITSCMHRKEKKEK